MLALGHGQENWRGTKWPPSPPFWVRGCFLGIGAGNSVSVPAHPDLCRMPGPTKKTTAEKKNVGPGPKTPWATFGQSRARLADSPDPARKLLFGAPRETLKPLGAGHILPPAPPPGQQIGRFYGKGRQLHSPGPKKSHNRSFGRNGWAVMWLEAQLSPPLGGGGF